VVLVVIREENGPVTENQLSTGGPTDGEDLEYELAHEGHDHGDDRACPVPDLDQPGSYVATETPQYAGDYGYDMSHDLPKP
jgi:hypothetical protein